MRFQFIVPIAVAIVASLGAVFGNTSTLASQESPNQPGELNNQQPIAQPMTIAPGRLNLRAGDVVTAERPNLRDMPRVTFQPAQRYVIQLDGPMTPQRRAALNEAGVKLGDYLPTTAYIADLAGVDAADLRNLDFVEWVGEYADDWKLDPQIGQFQFVTPGRQAMRAQGRAVIEITLFEGFELDPALEQILAIPGVVLIDDGDDTIGQLGANFVVPVEMPLANVPLLSQIDAVQFVEEAAEFIERRNNSVRWIVQTNQNNNTVLYTNGLHGEGQIVGILDSRIDSNHCSFVDPSNPIGPSHRKIHAYNASLGASSHGTHVGGTAVGDAGVNQSTRGVAYLGRLVYNTMPNLTQSSVQSRHNLHHSQGARVHSNSWGAGDHITSYHGATRAIDLFMRSNEESLVVHSVANSSNPGPTISIPENAKNLLAVGASGKNTTFPNQNGICTAKPGPTADGRRKPEIFAPGCATQSANNNTTCGTASSTGTSMATPAVSGVAMLVRQYYMDGYYPTGSASPSDSFTPSAALIKATLLNSAQRMTSVGGAYPSDSQGWGRVQANEALHFTGQNRRMIAEEVRNNVGLSTNQQVDYPFEVTGSGEVLRVTLAFTDVAGASGASNPVVNDLDLEVVSPTGTLYRGNVFSGNFSTTGGSKDPVNNVEQVHLANPMQGEWIARVKGAAVNSGLQGYGIIISGEVIGGDVVLPPPPPPSNDTCATSLVVGAGDTFFGTVNATTAGPDEPGMCNFGGYTHIESDVWFRHTAQCTGDLTVSVCDANFDAKMAVYPLVCPTSSGSALACSDNVCGSGPQVTLSAVAGATYRIRVGGFEGAQGTGTLVITCGEQPPDNDNCEEAMIVRDPSTPFTTQDATSKGPDEPGICNFGGSSEIENDVWFLVQADCSGELQLNLCDIDFDAKMAVYGEECPLSSGEALGCDDGDCAAGTEITVPVAQDEYRLVRVGGIGGVMGSGTLDVLCVPGPDPCPADLDGNNSVNVFDLLELLGQWGPCADPEDCPADLDDDGAVNVFDLLALLGSWGDCPG